jgi:hypothetical protein
MRRPIVIGLGDMNARRATDLPAHEARDPLTVRVCHRGEGASMTQAHGAPRAAEVSPMA